MDKRLVLKTAVCPKCGVSELLGAQELKLKVVNCSKPVAHCEGVKLLGPLILETAGGNWDRTRT